MCVCIYIYITIELVLEIDTRCKTQKLHHLSPKGDNCTSSAADLKKLEGPDRLMRIVPVFIDLHFR